MHGGRSFFLWLGLLTAGLGIAGERSLEEVAQLSQAPGNITLTPEGRLIMSLHQFYEPELRVVELGADGQLSPFPNSQWARGKSGRITLDSVLGIQSGRRGVVWMLDNGLRSNVKPKLVAWDTRANRLARVIPLVFPVTPHNSFVNDLAVDRSHNAVYIADPAGGNNAALIVVDLETGYARRLLEGHSSVVPEDIDLVIDGTAVRIRQEDGSLLRPHLGVNPIALDVSNDWLYFGPMHGTSLYRIETRRLLNEVLDDEQLGAYVERYSAKPICDGIAIDRGGNIYISDIANHAIGVIGPDREYRRLVTSPKLSWPDAFSFGPEGELYTVANQLHKSAVLNGGDPQAEPPFYVFRIPPLAAGIVGR